MGHLPSSTRTLAAAITAWGLCFPITAARAQDYGLDWVTIGDAGNRDTLPHEVPWQPDLAIGGVEHEYRITRTELTVQQHFEYVQAYWQYLPPEERTSPSFLGFFIRAAAGWDDPQYYIYSGAENYPTTLSWRHAARFCNWLHNGKAAEQWAFEQGAYDASTFTDNSDGSYNDQAEHDPDARFWIPTEDEQVKALFWDPAKNAGDGGYWRYPHSSDEPPIPGLPWEGGETNAGFYDEDILQFDAGSYPWAASPWGLLDGSGGESEWNESGWQGGYVRGRRGTMVYQPDHQWVDRLDYSWVGSRPGVDYGLRLAALVPIPSTCVIASLGFAWATLRRRVS